MAFSFSQPAHAPCPDCGASVLAAEASEHGCDPERRLDYQLVQLRDEIGSFDAQLAGWFETAQGRFAVWLAGRDHGAH